MELKDSKTKINLMKAFAGESQARNRYTIAATAAKKENFQVIEQIFNYTATQELAHANVFYKHLKEFSGQIIRLDSSDYPVNLYDSTLQNLKAAQHNEFEEFDVVYKNFGKTAQEEGFPFIAGHFNKIAEIEKVHSDRFARYAQYLESGTLFKKNEDTKWFCLNCGYIYEGKEAPKVCPVCDHPQGYYILLEESPFE